MSRNRKTVYKGFSYLQCDDFAAYLGRMAEQGWHFREWKAGLVFEKGEPEKVEYAVEVFIDGSEYDTRPEVHTKEFAAYCEAAGWQMVDAKRKFVIFRKTRPDAVEIMTPRERLDNIAAEEKKDILSKMAQEGAGYAETLAEAQRLGYAEADPTNDVEGYDAAYKLSILASLAFHTKVPYAKIFREGISNISGKDITFGKEFGYTLKLLAIAKNIGKGVEVRVHPTFIPSTHPLASVNDAFNAVYLKGDAVGDIMLYGRGAGALPTASAVVSDVIYAATHSEVKYSTFKNNATAENNVKFVSDFTSAYYIRLGVDDEAGVLTKMTGIFAKYGVSIVEVAQKGRASNSEDLRVPLVIITHKTTESSIKNTVAKINASGIATVKSVIRVEE